MYIAPLSSTLYIASFPSAFLLAHIIFTKQVTAILSFVVILSIHTCHSTPINMKPIALVTTLSLTVSTVWASGHVLARKAPSLHPRVSFQGGWPIQADTCPSNTTMCQFKDSCCPTGTNCYIDGLGGATACCPTSKYPVIFDGQAYPLNDSHRLLWLLLSLQR